MEHIFTEYPSYWTQFITSFTELLKRSPNVDIRLMGFPTDWLKHLYSATDSPPNIVYKYISNDNTTKKAGPKESAILEPALKTGSE